MTKIKNYALDGTLSSDDKWVGTDENGNATVNFSLGSVAAYVLDQVGNGAVDDTPRILVRTVQAGAIINGQGIANDNPAKAINRSFRGGITVSRYEIVLFQVQRQVLTNTAGKEAYKLLNEQYYYRGGEGVIAGDLDETNWQNDLTLDYSIEVTATITPPTKGSPAETATVAATDTSNPADTISSLVTLLALDSTSKNQYVALYDTVDNLDYRFYIFDGPVGSYGDGGLAAIPAYFTEITKIEPETKTKLSEYTNDGDGSNPFATTDTIPANTSDLVNDGDGVSNFALLTDLPANVSELANDAAYITAAAVPTNVSELANDAAYVTAAAVPANTSDIVNDGSGSGKYVEVVDVTTAGSHPYMKQFKITVSAAAGRAGATTPIQVAAAPGAGYAWGGRHCSCKLTWGSVAYDGGGDVYLKAAGAASDAFFVRFDNTFLASTSNQFRDMFAKVDATSPVYIENAAMNIQMEFDSTVGDSPLVFYVTLELIQL